MLAELVQSWNSLFAAILASIGAFQNPPPNADHTLDANKEPGWAVVTEVKGSVRHKRSFSSLWNTSKVGTVLNPGDHVYVEEGGEILLRYTKLKASLYCSTPSMFFIDKNLEHMRYQDTSFALFGVEAPVESAKDTKEKETKKAKPKKQDPFQHLIERPGDNNSSLAQTAEIEKKKAIDTKLEELAFNLEDNPKRDGNSRSLKFNSGVFAFIREAELLEWKFPRGSYDFVSSQYPNNITVEVYNVKSNPVLFGYLWPQDDFRPSWSGVSRGRFVDVQIPEPGTYRMQIISEDSSAISDVLWIRATTQKESDLIPKKWEDGRMRWLDD